MPAAPKKERAPVGLGPGSSRGRPLAAANRTMWAPGCRRFWSRCGQVAVLLLLLGVPPRGLALPPVRYSHAGICPNDMNPNLWVDAQSTCKRECETDQVSGAPEACDGPRVLVRASGGRGWGRLGGAPRGPGTWSPSGPGHMR